MSSVLSRLAWACSHRGPRCFKRASPTDQSKSHGKVHSLCGRGQSTGVDTGRRGQIGAIPAATHTAVASTDMRG